MLPLGPREGGLRDAARNALLLSGAFVVATLLLRAATGAGLCGASVLDAQALWAGSAAAAIALGLLLRAGLAALLAGLAGGALASAVAWGALAFGICA